MRVSTAKIRAAAIKEIEQESYAIPAPLEQPARKVSEAEVLEACKAYLEKRWDLWWQRMEAPIKIIGRGTKCRSKSKGLADLMICQNGRLIACELKKPFGGELSGHQAQQLGQINYAGGLGCVVTSARGLLRVLTGEDASMSLKTPHGTIPIYH